MGEVAWEGRSANRGDRARRVGERIRAAHFCRLEASVVVRYVQPRTAATVTKYRWSPGP
jgi:hypothetical protein